MNRRCLNCMKMFMIPEGYEADDNCCPYCGFIENTLPQNISYLRTGVVLKDRYVIGTVIGAGGFGITYKAWDNTLDTVVAIKEFFPQGIVLRDNTTSKTNTVSVYNVRDDSYEHGKERFLKEARSLAKFNSHPGTVVIYDFFEENETAYIVMEYLDGCNMREYMAATNSLPTMEMLRKMIDTVCDVLVQVHSVGLIHRDISPDNIFMCLNGTFKLIDFGSVKQGMSDSNLSSTVILKHGYAPIEQYTKSGKVGPWTDIYALAATIYMLSTGVMPQESVERMSEDEIEDICKLNSAVPRSFGNAVMKALSVQIKDRYQSVEDFRRDIFGDEVAKKSEEIKAPEAKKEREEIKAPEAEKGREEIKAPEAEKGREEIKAPEAKKEREETKTPEVSRKFDWNVQDEKHESFISRHKYLIIIAVVLIIFIWAIVDVLSLNEYRDESQNAVTTEATTQKTEAATSAVNNESSAEKVFFGRYWYDDTNGDGKYDKNDGKKLIEWRVLKKYNDGTAMVISDKILDGKTYNESNEEATWKDSNIRIWLNSDFYYDAFSSDEVIAIKQRYIRNDDSDTKNNVFLLSSDEAKSAEFGFSETSGNSSSQRTAMATPYAAHQALGGVEHNEDWWLRSVNDSNKTADVVTYEGGIGSFPKNVVLGVRPVIFLDLNSEYVKKSE